MGPMYGMALLQADRLAEQQRKAKREQHFARNTRRCFVKVTGDLVLDQKFIDWVSDLARTSKVAISVGGGTPINNALDVRGIMHAKHPRLGRDTTAEGYAIAKDVLRKTKTCLEQVFDGHDVIAEVLLPVMNIAGEDCHVDGDLMMLNAYWGFNVLYVVTTPDRVDAKRTFFADLPKVEIISF